jgi:transcriptional regulator PpsR
VKRFEAPAESLGGLDADAAAALITAAADVSLIVDSDGVIQDVAFGSEELALEGYGKWIGQAWVDTVTLDSRPKVEALLREAGAKSGAKWRHVNHPSQRGGDVPILYSAVQVGARGRVVAFGRDLRSVAALQQRLVDAQQSMERDYWRLRHLETRYRLLFQMASEAVLIVDAATQKIVEANPAAGQMLGENVRKVVGRPFPEGFDPDGTEALQTLMAAVRATGKADDVRVRLSDSGREFVVSASLFRQDNTSLFLVRLAPLQFESTVAAMPKTILKVVESAPMVSWSPIRKVRS